MKLAKSFTQFSALPLAVILSSIFMTTSLQAAPDTQSKPGTAASASKTPGAPAYSGPPVLDPQNFFGQAAMGYAAAKAVPGVVSKLFCYCGCDASESHKRLIDCFTGNHGVDCHICQEEAIDALKMHRDGVAIAEIQKQIDEKYMRHYPFTEDTANYKEYKASRLYKADASSGGAGSGPTTGPQSIAGPMPASQPSRKAPPQAKPSGQSKQTKSWSDTRSTVSTTLKSAVPKVKAGFTVGDCCKDEKR